MAFVRDLRQGRAADHGLYRRRVGFSVTVCSIGRVNETLRRSIRGWVIQVLYRERASLTERRAGARASMTDVGDAPGPAPVRGEPRHDEPTFAMRPSGLDGVASPSTRRYAKHVLGPGRLRICDSETEWSVGRKDREWTWKTRAAVGGMFATVAAVLVKGMVR